MDIFKKIKSCFNKGRSGIIPIAAVLLSAAVLLMGLISISASGTKAKYKTTVEASMVAVTVNADLADELKVLENKAIRNDAGDYSLDPNSEVSSNSYVLMPGVEIKKDPFVRVIGKSPVSAYLYIEVLDNSGFAYSYSIRSSWTELSEARGKHFGTVYVYNNGNPIPDANTPAGDFDIYILEGDKISVSPALDLSSESDDPTLTFYAYMAQAVGGKTAAEVYNSQFAPS